MPLNAGKKDAIGMSLGKAMKTPLPSSDGSRNGLAVAGIVCRAINHSATRRGDLCLAQSIPWPNPAFPGFFIAISHNAPAHNYQRHLGVKAPGRSFAVSFSAYESEV